MQELDLHNVPPIILDKIKTFFSEILKPYSHNIHSIYIVGSAITADFNENVSDINSIIILNEINNDFIRFLSTFGNKYRKKKIAAPLVMTPQFILNSLDVFPIEFHDFKLIHQTILGPDILSGLEINKRYLRLQCEREAKAKIVGLRQGYISSSGDRELITSMIIRSFTGLFPFFRAILFLLDMKPPILRSDVIKEIQGIAHIQSDIFERMLLLKNRTLKPSMRELDQIFDEYCIAFEKIANIVDKL